MRQLSQSSAGNQTQTEESGSPNLCKSKYWHKQEASACFSVSQGWQNLPRTQSTDNPDPSRNNYFIPASSPRPTNHDIIIRIIPSCDTSQTKLWGITTPLIYSSRNPTLSIKFLGVQIVWVWPISAIQSDSAVPPR